MEDASLPPPPAPALCWDCGRALEPADRFCRFCGQGQGEHVTWYYRRWGILVATGLGLGPFGLVLVRRTPVMAPPEKWAWAAGIAAVTVWLGYRLYQAVLMVKAVLGMASGQF
ncbi:hypothetical protein EPO15_10090 [bacterium]|nr:MAG: hypothetical protein EPO15_10090 [bacterium]